MNLFIIYSVAACEKEHENPLQMKQTPVVSTYKQYWSWIPLFLSSLLLLILLSILHSYFCHTSHCLFRVFALSLELRSLFCDMAITHDDLSVRKFRSTDISGKLALFLVIFSVLCGVAAFILCLTAEGARSEVTWLFMTTQDGYKGYRCYYNGSGRVPLASAVAAFLVLAVAMFAEHAYMLVAVTSHQLPVPGAWPALQDPRLTPPTRDLTWQVCCLFLTTWFCFALAEILLLIGIGVESGHLSNWTAQRSNCHAIRPGAFAVAGVFGLITVFLGVGLYLTALRTVRQHVEEAKGRRAGIPSASDQHPQLPPLHLYPHLPPMAPRAPHSVAAGAQHGQQQPLHVPEKIPTSA